MIFAPESRNSLRPRPRETVFIVKNVGPSSQGTKSRHPQGAATGMGVYAADQTPRTHPNQFDTTYRVPLRPATDPAAESFSPSAVTTPVTPAAHPAVAAYHLLRAEPYPAGGARTCVRRDNSTAAVTETGPGLSKPVKLFIDVSDICPEKCHAAASASTIGVGYAWATPYRVKSTTRRCHRGTSPVGRPGSAVRRACPGGLPTRCGPPPLPGVQRCGR